ncbi:restriction endonuclease subunit S [Streptococcus acidominimus]|uniref:restriction endonuclease subunit S n=1 Tax=Streptococcus acidominimus TaxID=1326 RepID=UPI0013012C33|nr:restriction endonuclease subunit S [Streptococcus acidominimus]
MAKLEDDFAKAGGEWRETRVGDLFDIRPTKNYGLTNQRLFEMRGNTPVVVNSSLNNGIGGYVDLEPTEKGNIVTFSDTTTSDSIFYQPNDFIGYSHVQGMFPYIKWSKHSLLYFVISFRAATRGKFDYGNKFNRDRAKEVIVTIPYKNKEIAFQYMENYIKTLEAERIETLEAYLTVTGLRDYHLTKNDEEILDKFAKLSDTKSRVEEWGIYAISSLFSKLDLKCRRKDFDKIRDTSKIPTEEFNLPLVNAKIGDNGVMFYGREEDFDTAELTIDIISNGAVATGTVYPQIKKVGVLWDAYLLKSKIEVDRHPLIFLSTSLEKSIKQRFGWENKAVWNKVQKESISLPSINAKPDYNFMSDFIKVIEKLVIKDLVEWTDRQIEVAKEVVGHV